MNHDSGIFVDVFIQYTYLVVFAACEPIRDATTLRLYDCEHLLTPRDFKAGSRVEAVFFGG